MTSIQEDFVKRKKAEKRAQAIRQVREAYANLIEGYTKDREPIKGFDHKGEFVEWRIRMEPEIEDLYTSPDTAEATGVRSERLRDWIARKLFRPSLPPRGHGTIALFTKTDVVGVALFAKLVDLGLSRELASEYMKAFVTTRVVGTLNYIIVISSVRDGKPIVFPSISLAGGDGSLKLEIDQAGSVKVNGDTVPDLNMANVDNIHIINIDQLWAEVDAALAQLD